MAWAEGHTSTLPHSSSCSVVDRLAKRHSSRLTRHVQGKAPWLHGHYPASLLLWASPTPIQTDHAVIGSLMTFEYASLGGSPRFLDASFRARSPLSPRGALQVPILISSLQVKGFSISGSLAAPNRCNEAESGSLALRLALSPLKASPDRVTPSHARSATCQTGNLQGELLSVHKIDQAWPGAPG